MKTKKTIIAIILLLSSTVAFSQNTPFKKWHENSILSSTYITKAMLDMVPDMKVGDVDIKSLNNILEQVEIYSNIKNSTSFMTGLAMNDAAIKIVNENKYELMLKLSESDAEIAFYSKRSVKNKDIVEDLVMINFTRKHPRFNGECTVIRLVGEFTLKDIRKITNKKK